jgi:hypothetical protein
MIHTNNYSYRERAAHIISGGYFSFRKKASVNTCPNAYLIINTLYFYFFGS